MDQTARVINEKGFSTAYEIHHFHAWPVVNNRPGEFGIADYRQLVVIHQHVAGSGISRQNYLSASPGSGYNTIYDLPSGSTLDHSKRSTPEKLCSSRRRQQKATSVVDSAYLTFYRLELVAEI